MVNQWLRVLISTYYCRIPFSPYDQSPRHAKHTFYIALNPTVYATYRLFVTFHGLRIRNHGLYLLQARNLCGNTSYAPIYGIIAALSGHRGVCGAIDLVDGPTNIFAENPGYRPDCVSGGEVIQWRWGVWFGCGIRSGRRRCRISRGCRRSPTRPAGLIPTRACRAPRSADR